MPVALDLETWSGTPLAPLSERDRKFVLNYVESRYQGDGAVRLAVADRARLARKEIGDAVKYCIDTLFQSQVAPEEVAAFLLNVMRGEEPDYVNDPLTGSSNPVKAKLSDRLKAAESLSKNIGRTQKVEVTQNNAGYMDLTQMTLADQRIIMGLVRKYPHVFGLSAEDIEDDYLTLPAGNETLDVDPLENSKSTIALVEEIATGRDT